MRGVVKVRRGPGAVEYKEVPDPQAGPAQVKVAVIYAGICGSDIHILHDQADLRLSTPVVMGHEFVGRITEVGIGVETWAVGDRVVSETAFSVCGACDMCQTGHDNVCPSKELIGFVHNGAFADSLILPATRLHRPDPRLTDVEAAVSEPVAGCVHGVIEQCGVRDGDLVVIVGPGTVGLLDLQIAKAAGASVILCGRSPHRLALGMQLGADYIVDLKQEDPRLIVNRVSRGIGCDVFVEASGTSDAVMLGLALLRRRGKYLQQGLISHPAPFQFDQIAFKELSVFGTFGQKRSAWVRGLNMMALGQVQIEPIVSDILPMSSWLSAFELVEGRTRQKVLLQPG